MTSGLDGVDAQGSSSQQEAYTPFPDVSGLRTSATGRGEAIDVKLALHIATPEDVAAVEERHGWPQGTLAAAAWAALLYHYIPQESTDSQGIAFVAGPKQLLVRLPAAPNAEWSILELGDLVSRPLQDDQPSNAPQGLSWITWKEEAPLEDHEMTLSMSEPTSSSRLRAQGRIHGKESAELFALQHQHLLASFCKVDSSLPALSPERLPDTLRAGDNPSPRQISLPDDDEIERELFHHQLQRRARGSPHAIALDFRVDLNLKAGQGRNTLWTYAELDRRASRLANEIQARRCRSGGELVVALCLEKSPESYVAQLACLYAGAAWCPIDRGWPEERKAALLAKSGAMIVIATRSDKHVTLPEGMSSIVIEDVDWNGPTELPPLSIDSSALAYKIWTSGTTGLPKAVGIEHKAAVQALRALQDVIPHPDDATQIRYLQFSAYVFDLSILDCFYTWGLGGTLCACPRELLLTDLIGAANAMRVTHSLLTPAVMAMTPRSSIPSLRVVINGGEKLTQVVADTWTQDCTLLNLYGPAEATLIAMHRTVPSNDFFKAPNIGVALPTVSCHVLDPRDRVVIKGAVGQLALGGYQCARGYIGDEEKTAAKFKQHPQLGRVYMTGDLVRQLADGSFEYLGREDDQIKINGIRIETLEISAIVRNSHKDIKDSETLAIALGGTEDEQLRIVNFSVVQGGAGGDGVLQTDSEAAQVARELRGAAQRALPSYMVPSLFVIVSHFPRTSSAKIDRVALKKALAELDVKAWEASIAQGDGDDAAEKDDETDPRLRATIAELCSLREDQIGTTMPFPSLGLDSIKAMILARRLNDAGMAVVSVVDIIEHDSLAKLSRKIRGDAKGSTIGRQERGEKALQEFDARHKAGVAEHLGCGADELEAVLPTTPLQQGMLAETLRDANGAAYWLNRLYEVRAQGKELASKVQDVLATVSALRVGFLQNHVPAAPAQGDDIIDTPFVQVMWRSTRQIVRYLSLKHDAEVEAHLVAKAKGITASDPATGVPPLAILVAEMPIKTLLFLRIHHALYDARTLEMLANRLDQALSGSDASTDPTQDIRVALPYIVPLNNSEREADSRHWSDALASFPRGHDVQFPRLGSTIPDTNDSKTFNRVGRTASVSWPTLSSAAQSLGTSARPLAQSAWATLLSSYLETQWIMLGDSVSGRTVGPNLDDVWGPLHATVPVPICVKGEQTKRGLVDTVDDFHRKTLPHQHVSLSEVRQALQLSPAASLFQSIFVFEASETGQKEGCALKHVRDLELSVEHPLAIEILLDAQGGLELGLFWRSDLMDRAHAEMLLSQYDAALVAFTTELDAAVSSWTTGLNALKLLSITEERPHEAVEAASKDAAVEVWLANGAQTHGHLAALEFWNGLEGGTAPHVVSYAQLHQDASRLSQLLTSSLPPQSIVAVCLRRCTYSYVALLATQFSGMAYLPIDENLPQQRQQLLVADSGAACVITETCFADRFAAGPQLFVTDEANFSRRLPDLDEAPRARASPDDLAYILYTSGSTGKPKGCRLTRRNLAVAIEAFRLVYESAAPGSLSEGVRFLARSAEAFDVALLETLLPLRVGGTIVTAPRAEILQDVGQAMAVTKVTHAAVVPSLFFSQGKRIGPDDLPALRALIVGGEKISQDIIDLWAGSRVPLLNAYGPTEATIGSSIGVLSPRSSPSSIGRPFHGTQYLVAKPGSDAIIPLLRGEAGELCVLGPQVGARYLGQEDQRAFTTWEGQPVYRTGDLARLTVDDEAMYLGRIGSDSQVKIRGARLELQEVDAAIVKAAKEAELNAVSIVHEDRIVSFVARRSSSRELSVELESSLQPTAQQVWRELRKSLPAHMVPSIIAAISHLPLASISGKVDAKALRQAWLERLREQYGQLDATANAARPLTEIESLLVENLRASLAKPPSRDVTHLDDLFALGLDSLSAIAFVSKLRHRGYDLAVSDLMAHSVLEDVAARVKRRDGTTPQKPAARGEQQAIPCTPLQESLLLQSLASNDGLYVSRISFDIGAGADTAKLKAAVASVVESNPIWRTTFVEVDGQFRQKVLPSSSIGWDDAQEPQQLLADITSKPPVRFSLEAGRLMVLAHHALFDGVTIDLLQRDVELAYRGGGLEARPPFSDAAVHIAQIATQESSKEFWLERLADYSLTPLPNLTEFASTDGAGLDRCGDEVSSSLSYSKLCAAAQNLKVTPQALVIAAFSSLFSQLTGENDSIFGLVLGGRTLAIEGADQIQGPLLSTVPFRTKHLVDDSDVSLHARNVHTSILSTYAHQHTPLARLNQWLDLQDQSLFNTLFSFLPQSSRPDPDSILRPASASMATEYPVAFEVQPSYDDSIALRIVFDPHHIPQQQAALLLKQFDVELLIYAQGSKQVQRPASSLLSLIRTTQTLTHDDHDAHFIRQFERHVASTPDATAIDYAANGLDEPFESLTYIELDCLSNSIAALLTDQPAKIVAVYMQRSLLFYASLLAIWKAGKTYLPLDPALPQERLRYMLDIAQVDFILADDGTARQAGELSKEVLTLQQQDLAVSPSTLSAPRRLSLSQVAYILFTSGSTGAPKAVSISHRALSAALLSWKSMLPHDRSSRMLQLASPGFDVSLIEICMPLAFGFTIASAPKDVLLEDLEDTFNKLRLTMADLPASLAPTVRPTAVPRLQWLMSGGDAIDERVIADWAPHGLINAWGPTEATIGNTLGFVKAGSKRSIVGKAYPTSSIYVLKPSSREVAYRGCVGELAVGGPQVAEGYLGRPELTAEAFITMPDGERVYRTGDRGRVLFDGTVEVLGRVSRGQVKLRGQRLELDEVSHAFRAQEAVADAATLFVQHPTMPAKQLVTWVALVETSGQGNGVEVRTDAAAQSATTSILAEVRKRLPSYMVPSHVLVAKGGLPLTPNIKIDIRALQKAFTELDLSLLQSRDAEADQSDSSQWTAEEEQLQRILASINGIESAAPSRTASFYSLGLDSLSAIRFARRIKEAGMGVVAVRDVLRAGNIAGLAAHLSKKKTSTSSREDARAAEARREIDVKASLLAAGDEITSVYPCTPLQESMIEQSIVEGGRLYWHHHMLNLASDVSEETLASAWAKVVASAEILRMTFHRRASGQGWVQAVHQNARTASKVVCQTADSVAEFWHRLAKQPCPFVREGNFANEPPVRLHLVRGAGGESAAILSLHHALYDGNTLPQLFTDFDIALQDVSATQRPPYTQLLPHLLPSMDDVQHWSDSLRDFQYRPPKESASPGGAPLEATKRLSLPVAEARSLGQSAAVSLRTVAITSIAKLLASTTQTRDIVLGQILSLRDAFPGAELVLGPAFNTLPVRVRFADSRMDHMLTRVQRESDEARVHANASLKNILKDLGSLRAPFDVLVDYQVEEAQDRSWKKLQLATPPVASPSDEAGAVHYPLNIEVRQGVKFFDVNITADANFYGADEVQSLLAQLEDVFVDTLRHPEQSADAMPAPCRALPPPSKQNGTLNGVHNGGAAEPDESTWSPLEEELLKHVLAICQAKRAQVTPSTSLVSLGFDSISAIRLANLARREGKIKAGVTDVVQGGSIRGIVKLVQARGATTAATKGHARTSSGPLVSQEVSQRILNRLGLSNEQVDVVLPALPGQAFHFASWLNSGKRMGGFYSFVWRVEPPLDAARLQTAWKKLGDHRAILRTTFAADEEALYSVVLREMPGCMVHPRQHGDLKSVARDRLRALAHERAQQSFSSPLARLEVLHNDTQSLLILDLPHALYDAWSLDMLVRDLEALYGGGQASSGNDYTGFVRHVSAQKEESKERAFWQEQLHSIQPTVLSSKRGSSSSEHQDVAIFLPRALVAPLSATRNLPPVQHLFMASYCDELRHLTGISRPVFGLYQAGRSLRWPSSDGQGEEEADKLATPTMNVLPIQAPTDGPGELRTMAEALRGQLFDRIKWEQSYLGDVCGWAREGSERSDALFDTYLNVIVQPPAAQGDAAQRWQQVSLGDAVDFAPTEEQCYETPIDGGMTRLRDAARKRTLDVDVVVSTVDGEARVDFGVRCDAAVMGEEELREMLRRMVERVERCLQDEAAGK